ncbi:MAG: hypothetical protein PHV34_23455 [Verrucomicrobiae bacterium]|nr:hypothetical protein [Verrucomicrobiae bacterium]
MKFHLELAPRGIIFLSIATQSQDNPNPLAIIPVRHHLHLGLFRQDAKRTAPILRSGLQQTTANLQPLISSMKKDELFSLGFKKHLVAADIASQTTGK